MPVEPQQYKYEEPVNAEFEEDWVLDIKKPDQPSAPFGHPAK